MPSVPPRCLRIHRKRNPSGSKKIVPVVLDGGQQPDDREGDTKFFAHNDASVRVNECFLFHGTSVIDIICESGGQSRNLPSTSPLRRGMTCCHSDPP